MRDETLKAIANSAAVPAMPVVATRCFRMTLDPQCRFEQLVELLSADAGIASGVLRLANSAMFGAVREIDSLKTAVTMLGLRRIRELVLARCVVTSLNDGRGDPIDRAYFWRRSVTTAVLASRLSATLTQVRADEAFVPGLLADIGVIVLARALPTRYGPIAEAYRPLGGDDWMIREIELLGVSHAEVSAMVLESWNLPEQLVAAVRLHHAAAAHAPAEDQPGVLAALIGASSMIAARLCEASEPVETARSCLAAVEAAGLCVETLAESLPVVERSVLALAAALGVEIIGAQTHRPLVDQIAGELAKSVS